MPAHVWLCLMFRQHLVVGESIGEDAERNLNEVDRFTKKLDLAVLGDQTPEEELVDDAPRFARLRGELVLPEGLFRRFDRDGLRERSGRSPRWLRGLRTVPACRSSRDMASRRRHPR